MKKSNNLINLFYDEEEFPLRGEITKDASIKNNYNFKGIEFSVVYRPVKVEGKTFFLISEVDRARFWKFWK